MSSEQSPYYQNLLKLSKEQLDELLAVFTKLWLEVGIILERRDEGMGVFTQGSLLVKYSVKNMSQPDLSINVGLIVETVNTLLHEVKDKKTIAEDLKLSPSDADKLLIIWDTLEKSGILQEIDYRFHSAMPSMDMRSFAYDIRFLLPAHFKGDFYPCCVINFKVDESGQSKPITFELTKTEVKKLVTTFQKIEKEIEQSEYNMKKGEK